MDLAIKGKAKRLAVWHHDPNRTDKDLAAMIADSQAELKSQGAELEVFAAKEKDILEI
jgi:hypothetical protein